MSAALTLASMDTAMTVSSVWLLTLMWSSPSLEASVAAEMLWGEQWIIY